VSSVDSAQTRRISKAIGRRGIIAACVAATAAIADRFARTDTALATDGQPILAGVSNTSTQTTTLTRSTGATGPAVSIVDTSGAGGLSSNGSGGSRYGIFGVATGTGIGLAASAQNGPGAFLDSVTSVGFQGRSTSSIGVVGSTNGNVVLGTNDPPAGAFAANFVGGHGVSITGDFQASGLKSAVVKHKDGTLRKVYCLESAEPFFEDYGEEDLKNGFASVSIDPDFAPIVKKDDYHVFLTPYGESQGLYVSARTPGGFQVREQGGGKSNLRFSYRILARRGDVPNVRLQKAQLPEPPKAPDFIEEVRNRGGRP
jgi:hypothetical protein